MEAGGAVGMEESEQREHVGVTPQPQWRAQSRVWEPAVRERALERLAR
jgi:hypothetical protein